MGASDDAVYNVVAHVPLSDGMHRIEIDPSGLRIGARIAAVEPSAERKKRPM
jgi:hypothetical protein